MFALPSRVVTSMFGLLLVVGCSDSSGPNDNTPPPQSVMSATVNGNPWAGATVLAARSGNVVSISGRDLLYREIIISISGVTTAGQFAIGSGSTVSVQYVAGTSVWVGHLVGATGSVDITTLTSTHMTGSFTVVLAPQAATGALGTMTISGTFTGYFGQT